MTDTDIRLECLKLARNDGHNTIEETVKVACTYADFVIAMGDDEIDEVITFRDLAGNKDLADKLKV